MNQKGPKWEVQFGSINLLLASGPPPPPPGIGRGLVAGRVPQMACSTPPPPRGMQ